MTTPKLIRTAPVLEDSPKGIEDCRKGLDVPKSPDKREIYSLLWGQILAKLLVLISFSTKPTPTKINVGFDRLSLN